MRSVPPDIGETQPIIRIVDVLPAPFGPRNPNDSPGATSKSMASTAMRSPNIFVSPRAWMSEVVEDGATSGALVSTSVSGMGAHGTPDPGWLFVSLPPERRLERIGMVASPYSAAAIKRGRRGAGGDIDGPATDAI